MFERAFVFVVKDGFIDDFQVESVEVSSDAIQAAAVDELSWGLLFIDDSGWSDCYSGPTRG